MLRVSLASLWVQKAGNAPEEFEDAYQPKCGEHTGLHLRFAVADGATEGMLSGLWAQLLTKVFKRHWRRQAQTPLWLVRAYEDWERVKQDYVRQRQARNRPIQWYEEPGLEAGAFSTLLGLSLWGPALSRSAVYEAVALGDSCLFHVRNSELILQFPFDDSNAFNNRPLLLSSNPARNRRILENLKSARGGFRTGDRFYMLTDAFAAWFMKEYEAGRSPWLVLEQLYDESPAFGDWIETLRQNKQIRNDDVTCLRLEIM